MEIALVIGLLIVAIILFVTEKFSVDVVTIGLILGLSLSGIISPKEAFQGFSSNFIIILASIFIISGALAETGLLDKVGSQMIKVVKSKTHFIGYTMFVTGVLSAFMNNTTVTALVRSRNWNVPKIEFKSIKSIDSRCLPFNPWRNLYAYWNFNERCRKWLYSPSRNGTAKLFRNFGDWTYFSRHGYYFHINIL